MSSPPTAEFSPAAIVFPATALGDTTLRTVTLVSRVGWNQTIDMASLTDEFSMRARGTTGDLILQAGRTLELEARFHPKSEGSKETEIRVQGAVCAPLSCRGAGKEDPCRVVPNTLAFGRLDPGEARTLGFTIYCDGPDEVRGNVASPCPEFSVTVAGGPYHLVPGESLNVEVRYAPQDLGEDACTVSLGATWCESVPCSGRASHTWRVLADGSGDAPTVQAGIDSASHGDLVLVGPGRYYETINLRGKRIHLLGEQGRDATILDGSRGDDSVVVCESGETNETIIEGFTITGGKGRIRAIDGRIGGGILCQDSTPVIQNNTILGNSAARPPGGSQSRGGGLLYGRSEGSPELAGQLILRGNVIRGNFASNQGGGAYLDEPCLVENNVILDNRAGTDGGGLHLDRAWILVRRNVIAGNTGEDHGGGIYVWKGPIDPPPPMANEITENLFVGNSALGVRDALDCSGGAIWVYEGAWVHHNTIIFNHGESRQPPAAGGICLYATSQGTLVESNLIYRNSEGGLVAFWWSSGRRFAAEARRNLLFANGPEDVYNNQPEEFDLNLEENVFQDPLLCVDDLESNGSVAANSPALTQPWGPIGSVAAPGCGPLGMAMKENKTVWRGIPARHGP